MDKMQLAIELLKNKYEQLGRLPKRDDFDSAAVCLIKQKLGPWPRALEKAGLKEPASISSAEKNKIKRKRNRKNSKLNKKISLPDNSSEVPSEKTEE